MRGRKPKPIALRLIEGNPGKRPIPNVPKPERVAPRCPGWMPEAAKKHWRRLAPELESLGLLTALDGWAFAALCVLYERWRGAEEVVAREGMTIVVDGRPKAHPAVRISTQASQILLKFLQDFAMTPSSRSRIHLPPPVKPSLREQLEKESKYFPESS